MSDLNSEITEWVAIAKGDKCPLCKGTGSIRGGHVTCPKCGGKKVAKDASESLATVMRHDQDHDNWHKMHGDAPCTSEADCAQKRAKYAEVQAELNKSADEMLAEIEQWREIQKGDVAGHAFHGNQWTAVVDAQRELFPASNLHLQHSDDNMPSAISAQHERAAELHIDQKNRLKELVQKAVDEGHPITANRLKEAMGAHADAALEHQNAAQVVFDKGVGQDSVDAAYRAVRASRDANEATLSALEDAQATGLAPADLMKSVDFTKGDTPGHVFHGNQWTQSSGELRDRALKTWKDVRSGGDAGPASEHANIAHAHRETAKAIEYNMKSGGIPMSKWGLARTVIEAHQRADASHINASAAAMKVAEQSIKPATGSTVARNRMSKLMDASKTASEDASYASANADDLTKGL